MFYGCSSLTVLDLSKFNTSNVTTMAWMFCECGIQDLDVQSFDTTNVTSMEGMFSGCSNLTTLDVSHFITSNVTDMGFMFNCCTQLQKIAAGIEVCHGIFHRSKKDFPPFIRFNEDTGKPAVVVPLLAKYVREHLDYILVRDSGKQAKEYLRKNMLNVLVVVIRLQHL